MHKPTRRESYQWRKKPVTIDAWQWSGDFDRLNAWLVLLGCGTGEDADDDAPMWENEDGSLTIPTLEGDHRCDVGDFIIRGVKGEFYPCKPDIFALTYEPASPWPCPECNGMLAHRDGCPRASSAPETTDG